ncbi:MAG: 3-oxoacyl-ACP synthase [Flavobacteriales bacterium]|nr:3-oxoacyl-ACP synthase [Flavobacteriales bacterium]
MKLSKIKIQLHKQCYKLAEEQITRIKTALQEVQDAANNETKSSAGDKHETGRAMAQLETEKLSTQLSEALKLEQVLQQINPELEHKIVGLGSLVITNNGSFYISVSLGKVEINDEIYFAISAVSPIGKLLLTKKEKESFSFNGKSYVILSVV